LNDDSVNLIALADELEELIQATIPKSTRVSKYGGTLFTLKPEEKEGQFCGVFITKLQDHQALKKLLIQSSKM